MRTIAGKGLIGIADSRWPESATVEKLAIDSGFEVVVTSEVTGLLAKKDQLTMVVMKLEKHGSLQDVIAVMRAFGDDIIFVIRAEATDIQTLTTLTQIPGVYVVPEKEFSSAVWSPIFDQGAKSSLASMEGRAKKSHSSMEVIFVDPKSQQLYDLVERLAGTQAAVLLQGPTGTGKEVLAKTLHKLSNRSNRPFVALNCAAMPEHLVEDMLFGHEKGAFTGASRELAGVFEQATGGTVFLDEIGDMPVQLQAKLLRVLQEKEVVRLGGRESIPLDFRLVAATNKDLKAGIADKTFREDLYYRISAFKLQIPRLSERLGDIMPLAQSMAAKHGINYPKFSESAIRKLCTYDWPGNVRELDNVIQRAVVFSDGGLIDADHLFFDEPVGHHHFSREPLRPGNNLRDDYSNGQWGDSSETSTTSDLQSAIRASEHDVIMEAIRSTRTREEAAKKLGISPRTLRYKMARLRDESTSMPNCA